MKNIIDVCCGSRMFHFDKNNNTFFLVFCKVKDGE